MDLPEFVNARLAELEAKARAVRPQQLYAYEEGGGDGWAVEGTDGSPGAIIGDRGLAAHIAAWDPARVLALCAAVRAIVQMHTGPHECPNSHSGFGYCVDSDECETLAAFVGIWADHPGFDPSWR